MFQTFEAGYIEHHGRECLPHSSKVKYVTCFDVERHSLIENVSYALNTNTLAMFRQYANIPISKFVHIEHNTNTFAMIRHLALSQQRYIGPPAANVL